MALVLLCAFGPLTSYAADRIGVAAKINGQPTRLVLDTSVSHFILFRPGRTADTIPAGMGAVFVPRDMQSEPLVAQVVVGSPAHLAGIRDGDQLLKIDDLDVSKWRTNPAVMPVSRFWDRPPGTRLNLTSKRGEQERQTVVVLKDILGQNVTPARERQPWRMATAR